MSLVERILEEFVLLNVPTEVLKESLATVSEKADMVPRRVLLE